jgi:signal transduction histidine kinase
MNRAPGRSGYLINLALFTTAYVVTGMIGLFIQTGHEGITPIWPPSGIALFAFCRYGTRMWPVVALGIAFLAWHQGIPVLSAAIAGTGNIAEAWLGWYLIRHFHIHIGERFRDAWTFLLLPALLAPLSAATIGSLGMAVGGATAWEDLQLIWFMWWLGDVCGIVLFMPLLQAWWRHPKRWSSQQRLAEWLVVIVCTMFIGWYTYQNIPSPEFHGAHHLQFLIMPFLLWASIRLGLRGATLVSLIACSWVLAGAAGNSGPFAVSSSIAMGLMESSFILVVTLTGLIVQGLFREHSLDMEDIHHAHDRLEDRVRERTTELVQSNVRLQQEIKAKEMTERALQQSEHQLYSAKETAERANASKSQFLAAASHDLRQPLQAIAAHSDLLSIRNTDPALARPIQQLADAARVMQELLEKLLDVSKLDAGAMTPETSIFSINSLLTQLHEQFQSLAASKAITLKLVPCTTSVCSDPVLLRVILQNLISNAIKYTDHGKVLIGCRHRGARLRIEVWDSGTGIPAGEQEAIFDEFYQLDNPARERSKGTGFGLAIVKRMAALLGHPLVMHSVMGKGSCFAVEVPAVASDQQAPVAAQPGTTLPEIGTTAVTVLLIEDDAIVLDANCLLLKTLGYKVIPASGAEDSMQWIATASSLPDIIISDYRLPDGCNGTQLVRKLRSRADSVIPAIILTGDITLPNDENHLPDNSLLLQKPVRSEELTQAITQLLPTTHPARSNVSMESRQQDSGHSGV